LIQNLVGLFLAVACPVILIFLRVTVTPAVRHRAVVSWGFIRILPPPQANHQQCSMNPESSFYLEQVIGVGDSYDDTLLLGTSADSRNASLLLQSSSTPPRTEMPAATPSSFSRRKVSSLIRVLPLDNPEKQQTCVFPMVPPDATSVFDANTSMDQVLKSPEQHCKSGALDGGLVLVTPNAIGKHIRAHITLETARLVSQVANLGTEDWLRYYSNFDDVEWNTENVRLREVAQDMALVEQHHGVVLSMGNADTELLEVFIKEAHESSALDNGEACTLSMLEIVTDKSLVDLLRPDEQQLPLRVHHPDQLGGIVNNLTQSAVDSENLDFLLYRGLQNHDQGVIIATLTFWPSVVDQELNRLSKCRYLQFVHLPSADAAATTRVDRTTIALRQSLSSLGSILRHFVKETDNLCSFRDGTLTKVLQRSLEPASTHVVVMGTVSSDSDSYERTVHTLNYMNQLFGNSIPASPFGTSATLAASPFGTSATPSKESLVPGDLAKHPAFLQSLVSDPRQRIAELEKKMSKTPTPAKLLTQSLTESLDDDDTPYRPTNYMDVDPLDFQSDYYKDPEEKKAESGVSPVYYNTSFQQRDLHQHEEEEDLNDLPRDLSSILLSETPAKTMDTTSLEYSEEEQQTLRLHHLQKLHKEDFRARSDSDDAFGAREEALDNEELFDGEDMFEEEKPEMEPTRGTRNIIQEDQVFEDAGENSQEKEEPIAASADTTEDPTTHFLRRKATFQPRRGLSSRPPNKRMDSMLSLMSTDTNEAGGPLVTTPGVPSSISLQIALEKARATKGQERKKIHRPPQGLDPSSHEGSQDVASCVSPMDRSEESAFATAPKNGADSFIYDLQELHGAVEEMRKGNNGSWILKAKALERLQHYLVRQETMNQRTADELNAVEEQLRLVELDYTEELEKCDAEANRDRFRAGDLERELQLATQENKSYEKVAEQAVSSIEGLHEEMILLKAKLKRTEIESEQRLQDFRTVREANEKLTATLKGVQSQASNLSFQHAESNTFVDELQSKVKDLTTERDKLKEQRDEDRFEMDELRLDSDNIVDAESRLQSKEDEIDELVQLNDDLSAKVFKQQKALSQEAEKREAEVETMALKMQKLNMELSSVKRRLEDEAGDQRSSRDAMKEEQSSLRQKIQQVESERDRLHDLRDTDLSEMETLKLESAMRADLEKRLDAAGSEIDRLRAARSKVHDGMAFVRAEAATRLEEKDNAIQQHKLELHQAKIEFTSLRRRLDDADAENDRIRMIYEEEQQRFATKLSFSNEELARLRSELAESARVRNSSVNEAVELKVAIRAREEEVDSLATQLDRVKIEECEAKEINKKLRESLYEVRDNTRAQVMSIAEKKRENDVILETEREKSTALHAENARLVDSLEKVRREQELDRDGLGTFKEDITKAMKDKSEALTKSARLEKQLKESEMRAEDLEHELELSKMRSNEDLLRKANEEYRSVHSSNAQLTEAINDLSTERDVLTHDIEIMRQHYDKILQSKATAETKAARLETILEQSKHSIEDLRHQLKISTMGSNVELLKKAREENRAHQNTEAELQQALERLNCERDEYHQALKDRNDEVEMLEENKKELEGHVSAMTAKLRITEHTTDELREELEVSTHRGLERARNDEVQVLREMERTRQQEERRGRVDNATVRAMEQEIESLRHQVSRRPSDEVTLAELRAEQDRHEEARHLIATLAHRSKASTEQRDKRILKLKASLLQVSEQKEAEIQALRARLHEWERSIVRDEEYNWTSDNHHY
jgi:hypothetical protein